MTVVKLLKGLKVIKVTKDFQAWVVYNPTYDSSGNLIDASGNVVIQAPFDIEIIPEPA